MKKITLLINTLAIVLFLGSCESKTKIASQTEEQEFNLESYLVKDSFVKLELKKMSSGHLHVFGKLNGIDGNFILDTGAGATIIEEKDKEKFQMEAEQSDEEATGAGGTGIQMQASDNNHLKIGALELNELNLMLMNLDHVNNAFESMGLEKVNGVIGADILTDNKAIIDYSNLVLYLKK